MAAGVRWISYILPLTYFTRISWDVMLKGSSISELWQPLILLTLLGAAVFALAMLRFWCDLAPSSRDSGTEAAVKEPVTT